MVFWVNVHECLIRLLSISKLTINLCLYKESFYKATILSTKTKIVYKSLVAEYPHLLPTSQIILNVKTPCGSLGVNNPKSALQSRLTKLTATTKLCLNNVEI